MSEEPLRDNLLHIAFEREPGIEAERRRRRAPPSPPRVAGRSEHGTRIAGDASSVVEALGVARQDAGLDPSRLLVLEFATWDAGAREVFETRLNAIIVDERAAPQPLTRVIALPPVDEDLDMMADGIVAAVAHRAEWHNSPSPAETLRIRRANQADIDSARRKGFDIPQAIAAAPRNLVVVDMLEKLDAGVLDEAGLVSVATLEETTEITHVLAQFESVDDIEKFVREAQHYSRQETRTTALPEGMRRGFFDGLQWVRARDRSDRLGARLRAEGFPDTDRFSIDVDLWHPGSAVGGRAVLAELRRICARHDGRVVDDLRTSTLVLARVIADRALAEVLLELDLVAQVNLPPLLPVAYEGLFRTVDPLPDTLLPEGTEPLVTVVDSGVLAGHPLLRGWVLEERDFDSGENTPVDRQGHGTQVAGLLVYGDVSRCIETGEWTPRAMVASAKVLRSDPFDGRRAIFPENHRPEKLVEDAIRYFHSERRCRIFNLSVGNVTDVYMGGRQFAWAEVLDQIARTLDVLLIVSAGNISDPPWPRGALTRTQFQMALRDLMLDTPHARLCSPATAAIAVTAGAIARSERARDQLIVAAPRGAPAPFSRLGPGYQPKANQRAIKPEFVAFGGNYGVGGYAGAADWVTNDPYLGEPTTRLNIDGGRPLMAVSGTSVAAPQVSFAAAFALRAAAETLAIAEPTANAARALLGAGAETPPCESAWLRDPERTETWEKLRLVGYGQVDVDHIIRALQNDVCLLAEDSVAEDHWHLYAIRVPPAFLSGRGSRGINVSLAFDPPVRASRREYLSRTMWFEVLKGLTPAEINLYRARPTASGATLSLPQSKLLKMRPTKSDVQWSTLQVRRLSWSRPINLPRIPGQDEPELHVLVGCQQRFPSGEDPQQRYALAVRFWHTDTTVEIHQQLRSRVRARAVARVRPRG